MSGVKLGGRESDLTLPECGLATTGGDVGMSRYLIHGHICERPLCSHNRMAYLGHWPVQSCPVT